MIKVGAGCHLEKYKGKIRHCECGVCGHIKEIECFDCSCCENFHKRSGTEND